MIMKDVLNFIESNRDRYLDELFDFLRIPSISSVESHNDDTKKCAVWLSENFKQAGLADVRIFETEGHPIVFAQNLDAGASAPTILIYGHYDVQPVDPLDLWDAPPFEPVIKNGKIYGRGTSDDKGQVFMHVKAVEAFLKVQGNLPVNVKFLIEGEEEAGSNHLEEFIEKNTDLLKCDTVMVSDTEWFADGMPSICYSLRGISFLEITLTGPNRDLHSGTFGGGVDNPLNALCWMVSMMKDRYGRITIPGFYDEVLALTKEEREGFKKLPFDEAEYCKDLEVNQTWGESGYTTLERVWARPTLDLNGIYGGYTGEGAKTVLPSKATAKFSMRLVPHQKNDVISERVKQYLFKLCPPTMKIDVNVLHGGNPVLMPIDSKGIKIAMSALKEAFGTDSVFMREGGSIPIVGTFSEVLNAPTVLMGMGLPGDNIHSPNESFSVENFQGGIRAAALFLANYK
jgi:acetylornithine deacetylase/succinyl-diaminopimelate desuccinylase-like protein